MTNQKSKIFLFILFIAICDMRYAVCESFAQDNNRLVTLTRQIMEAKSNQELYPLFKELKDLYFSRPVIKTEGGIPPEAGKDNKYADFVDFLKSLDKKKKTLEPFTNYYIALSRYNQLKYLEETQDWDEYFSNANTYRQELVQAAEKTVASTSTNEAINIYASLLLWQFHRDQQDAFSESALSNLMSSVIEYSKEALDTKPIKDVADQLLIYGEKGKSKELYRTYVDKLLTSNIKEEDLTAVALGFFKEGNLELSEIIYDVYIEEVVSNYPKEKSVPILIAIARLFSYRDDGPKDVFYAEKIFQKIKELAGEEVFNEELIYLRAFNLEKAKEHSQAKDIYIDLVKRNPASNYADEADFKVGIIYTYILRDIKTGRSYFKELAKKERLSPWVISSLYQLGLLSQWEQDSVTAKEYYDRLIHEAGSDFTERVGLAKERLKEIEQAGPIEYNLKTFLDVSLSLKEEYAGIDATKVDLRASAYNLKKDQPVKIMSTAYTAESGCMQPELQYLWSGSLGETKPSGNQAVFDTTYIDKGTKEINLVVISPTGIIDRGIDMLDVR